ncbi:glutamate--tRNA ligase [Spiribacter sp. C176]|uniref:Glutamate--tRNA ligase n=1 Tax=Spiribacter salilacus TaxID=2664894 RepID=A0A6N7R1B0_9GAMM|nr:glutamate--tRNA ligase [Spiribacter salilacus]MRH78764.1 glutamate--tRNA ligase [Spiribacter salilacus]
MTKRPVKTRFAPSPTGLLHAGNLRTAIFSALLAKSQNGTFLLRIEDSDEARNQADALAAVMEDLRWLGVHWGEGPDCGQPPVNWQQSARAEIHADYFDRLLDSGHAYPCFCTVERLDKLRRQQQAAGKPPRYDGHCAEIDPTEARARMQAGEAASLRLRVPAARSLKYVDIVRGEQAISSDRLPGDFVIRRADGTAAFLFANALDDALMGVTHVLRGEDHIANTPRQLLVLAALDLPVPAYGHLGLVVGVEGRPLSKRSGAASIADLRATGYRPEAVFNYLARLGYSGASDQLETLNDFAQTFDPGHLAKGPALFDYRQLDHWQDLAMAQAPVADLLDAFDSNCVDGPIDTAALEQLVGLVQPNMRFPQEINDWAARLFGSALLASHTEAAQQRMSSVGPDFFTQALAVIESDRGAEWSVLKASLEQATGQRGGGLMKPLRLALTGLESGPGLGGIIALMPAAIARQRLEAAAAIAVGAARDA